VGILIFGMAAAVIGRAVSDALNAYSLSNLGDSTSYPMYRIRQHVLAIPNREEVEKGGEIEVPIAIRGEEGEVDETEMVRARWEAEILPTRILDLYVLDLRANLQMGANDAQSLEERYTVYRPSWQDTEESEQLLQAKEEEFQDRLEARGETQDGEDDT